MVTGAGESEDVIILSTGSRHIDGSTEYVDRQSAI